MPDKQIYFRLIALWVICEAMLGGIIHGLKLPVSGLIVGSSAVICICLIANYYPVRGSILKATIIVAIFKMMLSPQSPFPAYIAVFFQGLIGEGIFLNRKYFRFNCLLFGAIALFESGVQRLFVMTVLFGMDIWKAIDIFISGITGQETVSNYSYYLASGYVVLHIVTGILIGWYAGKIPGKVKSTPADSPDYFIYNGEEMNTRLSFQRKSIRNKFLILAWIIFAGLFLHDLIRPEYSLIPSNLLLKLFLRSVLIILSWVVLINPVLVKLLHKWLEKKKGESQNDIREVLLLLPSTQWLMQKSWAVSGRERGYKRFKLFFRIVTINSLRNG